MEAQKEVQQLSWALALCKHSLSPGPAYLLMQGPLDQSQPRDASVLPLQTAESQEPFARGEPKGEAAQTHIGSHPGQSGPLGKHRDFGRRCRPFPGQTTTEVLTHKASAPLRQDMSFCHLLQELKIVC